MVLKCIVTLLTVKNDIHLIEIKRVLILITMEEAPDG